MHKPRHIGNWIFATWYIQENANPVHLLGLIANTGVHTIVCILEDPSSAVAEALMDCSHLAEGTEAVNDSHRVCFVNRCVFMVTLKRQVSEVSVQQTTVFDEGAFAIVHCRVQPLNTAVAVGIVTAPGKAKKLPPWLRSTVHDSVYKHGVRLLTGFGGDAKEQMSSYKQGSSCKDLAPDGCNKSSS